MPMFKPTFGLLLCALLAPRAAAQSFNLDFSTKAGAPGEAFGAAATQPGFWNGVPRDNGVPFALVGLDGVATAATVSLANVGEDQFLDDSAAEGELFALVADRLLSQGPPLEADFSGLQPGVYDVYTYAIDDFEREIRVTMNNDDASAQMIVAGIEDELVLGRTHVIHRVVVSDGSLSISAALGDPFISGVQLALVPAPSAAPALGLALLVRRPRRRGTLRSGLSHAGA
jgi:hypothetical protein